MSETRAGQKRSRHCRLCKQSRERTRAKFEAHVLRMERLLRDGLSTTSAGFREWQQQVWQFFEAVEGANVQSMR